MSSKKPRLGRNMNALLGGASRNRRDASGSESSEASPSSTSAPAGNDAQVPGGQEPSETSSEPTAIDRSQAIGSTKSAGSIAPSSPTGASVSVADGVQSADDPEGGAAGDIDHATSKPAAPADEVGLASTEPADGTLQDSQPASVQKPHLRSVSSARPESVQAVSTDSPSSTTSGAGSDLLKQIGIDQIRRGAWQPRRHFDAELLQELADSLKAQGMIQPVLVRPFANGAYELIAGERRWRAAQLAGIQEIPALIREMEDQRVAAVSLIENIQRKDLNPLEEAQAFERLCDEFGMTHKAVAESVGRSRASVSNLMRLLELHDEAKLMVDKGLLDMGHARALLGAPIESQPEIAQKIVDQGLTVRAVEKLIRDRQSGDPVAAPSSTARVSDPDIDRLSRSLGERLGTTVEIRHKTSGAGRLEISYTSIAELEGILQHIK